LDAENGPLSIIAFEGSATARTINGPLDVKRFSGTLKGDTENGPIEVKQASGTLTLRAHNGPLDIELAGDRWQGTGLDASTENGPIDLKIASQFKGGIVIETSGHAPFSCRVKDCTATIGGPDDESGRRVKIGSDPVLIRMSTQNGPVSI